MAIDILNTVVDRNGKVGEIVSINLSTLEGKTITVPYANFIEAYEEYVDPKDIKISQLEREIKELKDKLNKPSGRKRRKKLTEGEWKDIEGYIREGLNPKEIAVLMDVSDALVYVRRKQMRQAGEEV